MPSKRGGLTAAERARRERTSKLAEQLRSDQRKRVVVNEALANAPTPHPYHTGVEWRRTDLRPYFEAKRRADLAFAEAFNALIEVRRLGEVRPEEGLDRALDALAGAWKIFGQAVYPDPASHIAVGAKALGVRLRVSPSLAAWNAATLKNKNGSLMYPSWGAKAELDVLETIFGDDEAPAVLAKAVSTAGSGAQVISARRARRNKRRAASK